MDKTERNLFSLLSILFLIPIWSVQYVPIQDYPSHLLFTNIIQRYSDPELNYSAYYSIKYLLVPNLIFQITTLVLSWVMPLQVAGKIFLSLCIIGLPASLYYLLDSVNKRSAILSFLGFLLSYNWFFHLGLLNYVASIVVFSFALGYWLRHQNHLTASKAAIFITLTFLLYFSHLMTYALFVGTIILLALFKRSSKSVLFLLAPTIVMSIIYFLRSSEYSGEWQLVYYGFITDLKSFALPLISYAPKFSMYFCVLIYLFMGVLVFATIRMDCGYVRKNIFFSIFAALLLLYFVSPYHFRQWGYVKVRILPYVFIFLLLFVKLPAIKYLKNALLGGILVVSVMLLSFTLNAYKSVDKYLLPYAEVLERIPPQKTILPIPSTTESYLKPSLHFDSYYVLNKGGRSPNIFPGPFGVIRLKNDLPSPDLSSLRDLQKFVSIYDYIIAVGKHPGLNSRLSSYYKQASREGNISLYVRKDEYRDYLKYNKR